MAAKANLKSLLKASGRVPKFSGTPPFSFAYAYGGAGTKRTGERSDQVADLE
jgi:hypothetical protein